MGGGGDGGGGGGGGGGVYSVRFPIGMLSTARRLETPQVSKKGGSKLYILPNFDEK